MSKEQRERVESWNFVSYLSFEEIASKLQNAGSLFQWHGRDNEYDGDYFSGHYYDDVLGDVFAKITQEKNGKFNYKFKLGATANDEEWEKLVNEAEVKLKVLFSEVETVSAIIPTPLSDEEVNKRLYQNITQDLTNAKKALAKNANLTADEREKLKEKIKMLEELQEVIAQSNNISHN